LLALAGTTRSAFRAAGLHRRRLRLSLGKSGWKNLPEHSRPREKLRENGPSALTDEELVAAILGMGTKGVDVRTIARQVAGLIREHKAGLKLEHLLAVPGMLPLQRLSR
jgi:hypothetical protein